jgi:DNA-binding HxlR family transcriptional regulator
VYRKSLADQECSIARALDVVGEWWTLLILRDAFLGVRRFDEFQRRLGVARNVLNTRLQRLVDEGLLERRRYQDRPPRDEYRLTEKGLELWPALVALMHWGDRHLGGDAGPPVKLVHRDCGGAMTDRRVCADCDAELGPRDVEALPMRPGAAAPPLASRR